MSSVTKIKPYFREDLRSQIRSTYFSTYRKDNIDGARFAIALCLAFEIDPNDFIDPEQIQVIRNMMR